MARLEPMTPTGLIDEAVHVFKARPRTMIAIAACFTIPVGILVGFMQRHVLGGVALTDLVNDPSTTDAAARNDSGAAAALVSVLLPSVLLPFIAAAYAHVVVGIRLGHEIGAGEALRRSIRRWWALLASWVLVHLAEGAASFFAVGGVVVMAFFLVTAPAIALESLGPLKGIGRSWSLTSRRFPAALGIGLASGLVAYALGQALNAVTDLLGLFVGLRVGWIILAAGRAATGLVIVPIVALSTVLFYIDLRVRLEGLDLELAITERFERAAA
ncbi:MAG TPA: hypothetical protein VK461_07040 [Acidimicrobiales bacterium]|nr:hypothetical protein [Acidimicrobiales bacterium]